MSLVNSLLRAIVHADADALVLHAGDKPYVVGPRGQVDLASRGLTLDAVNGVMRQLLPPEVQRALDEFGAAQYELPPRPDFRQEQFTVVAARGGDDLWAEIRRRRVPDDDHVPDEMFGVAAASGHVPRVPAAQIPGDAIGHDLIGTASRPSGAALIDEQDDDLLLPDAVHLWGSNEPASEWTVIKIDEPDAPAAIPPHPRPREADPSRATAPPPPATPMLALPPLSPVSGPPTGEPPLGDAAQVDAAVPARVSRPRPAPVSAPADLDSRAAVDSQASIPPTDSVPASRNLRPPPSEPGVVLPMARNPIRAEGPPPVQSLTAPGLDRLLRVAAARGAETLYLATDARPSVRVDGENRALEGEPTLSATDVESLLLTLMPERSHEALRAGATTEWICDVAGVGRVRCMSVRDHRGPGGVFRLMKGRAVSTDQLALSREIQALATEPEGLVLIAGPRSSGKRTLISAFIDLINRTRRDHVISIESEINVVHDRGTAFVSQREVRGGNEELLAAARAALREDPDVLVIEDLRTGALMNVALEAAASGHLVIGGFSAHSAAGAIDRIIDLYAPEYRRQIQMALAEQVRGVVVQVLLRKNGGGRVAAREVLLNTPPVASAIAEGKTSQLPMAIEGGRRQGMVPLNDSLVGYVQSGTVDAREAYRRAADRDGFLTLLERHGVDTSAIERLG
jgi:twitching motility protein PilT